MQNTILEIFWTRIFIKWSSRNIKQKQKGHFTKIAIAIIANIPLPNM